MYSIPNSFFILLLFYNSFSLVFNKGCNYLDVKNGTILETNNTYPINHQEESISKKKKSCFELSYSVVFQQECCYDPKFDECTSDNKTSGRNVSCPNSTEVPNNCGLAGIYQPAHETSCTEIGLVGGYCCYVDFGRYGKSCIKTNKLNDDKNTSTDLIELYVQKYNSENNKQIVVNSVICDGYNLKIASRIFLIGLLLLI